MQTASKSRIAGRTRIRSIRISNWDGRQIAFDSHGHDYQWHIWTLAADGGAPRQGPAIPVLS